MPYHHSRRHIRHYEVPGCAVHVTWRLKGQQLVLLPWERTITLDVIRRSRDFGCAIHAAVIMDDHTHVLFSPGNERTSVEFVTSWKSNSSRLICRAGARTAPLWQRDFYQRWIRSPDHLERCATYIRANPARRWPGIVTYPWTLP